MPLLSAPGSVQMAIDRWLLEQHEQGLHPPTLRFYTWSPAAISLGYHQHQYPAFWQNLTWKQQSIELVRRPSGGRAVLHQGDLTYAIVASGLAARRTVAYQQLCEFLIQGWRSLGVELHYGLAGRGYIHQPNCFGTATAADLLMDNGAKFIGSAQLRRGNTLLQHGSMRIAPDRGLHQQVFGEAIAPVLLPDLLRLLPRETQLQTIVDALTQAARGCFDLSDWAIEPLSQEEWQEILATIAPEPLSALS